MSAYLDVLLDPHHIVAEMVWALVFDGLIGALLWPLIKRAVRRHDQKEHGAAPAAPSPQPTRRNGAVLACGHWTYKGVMPGQQVGQYGLCDYGDGKQRLERCNVEEPS